MGQIAQILLISVFAAVVNSAHIYLNHDGARDGFSFGDNLPGSLFDLFVPKKTEDRARKPFITNDEPNPDKVTTRSVDKEVKAIEKETLDRNVKINIRKPLDLKMPAVKKENDKNVKQAKESNPAPLSINNNEAKQLQAITPVPDLGSIVFRDSDSEEFTSTPPLEVTEIPNVSVNDTVLKENSTITPNVTVGGRFGEFLVFVPNDVPVSNQNVLVPFADANNNQLPQTQTIPVNFVPVNSIQNAQANTNGLPVLYDPTTSTVQTVQNLQPVYLQNAQSYQPVQSLQNLQPVQNGPPVQNLQSVQNVQPVQNLPPVQNVQPVQNLQPVQNVQPVQNLQPVQYVPMILQPNNVASGSPMYAIIQLPVQNLQAQNPNVFYVNNLPNTYQNNVPIYSLVPLSNVNGNYVSIPNNGNNLG